MTANTNDLPRIGVLSRWLGLAPITRDRHTAFVRRVEEIGYAMLWVTETFGRESFTHAAVVLARTESLTVGTGIANVWARDAMAMANGARTLVEAYPGRFVLGVGVSHDRLVERRAHTYAAALDTPRQYLQEMDEAIWLGPSLDKPVPRLVGALGPKALALSTELADGALAVPGDAVVHGHGA